MLHPERLESRTRGFKRLARLIPGPLLRRSQARALGHAKRINAIFDHCDVLLTPVTAMPPVKVGHWAEQGALRTVIGMSRVYPLGFWQVRIHNLVIEGYGPTPDPETG